MGLAAGGPAETDRSLLALRMEPGLAVPLFMLFLHRGGNRPGRAEGCCRLLGFAPVGASAALAVRADERSLTVGCPATPYPHGRTPRRVEHRHPEEVRVATWRGGLSVPWRCGSPARCTGRDCLRAGRNRPCCREQALHLPGQKWKSSARSGGSPRRPASPPRTRSTPPRSHRRHGCPARHNR